VAFNSGFYRFNGIHNLTQDDPNLMQKLTDKVLAEKLTQEEQDILINDYIFMVWDVVVIMGKSMILEHTAPIVVVAQKKPGMLQ
jgi:hypothetical protein